MQPALHPTYDKLPSIDDHVLPPCFAQKKGFSPTAVPACRLAIACYLVFLGECDAHNAILRVRQGRPGALQTQQQEHFVQVFQVYLVHLRYCQPSVQCCLLSLGNVLAVKMTGSYLACHLFWSSMGKLQEWKGSLLLSRQPCHH